MSRRGTLRRGRRLAGLIAAAVLVAVVGASTAAAQRAGEVPAGWTDLSAAQPAIGELAAAAARVAGADDYWVGYTFPLRPGVHVSCDEWRGRSISFGAGELHFHIDGADQEPHDGSCDDDFGVFLRFGVGDHEEVLEARLSNLARAERRLDEAVVWAGAYAAGDSIDYLRAATLRAGNRGSRAISTSSDTVRERLLGAIAVHDSDEARAVVLAALQPSEPQELRESAVFWTGQLAGDEGVTRLLDLARTDADTDVRKQAIFWLGQLAGRAATADLADIAESDPDTEVRTSAVFALSQSDDTAAVDALISIVRSNRNPEVVRSALFWLGESGGDRIIALFEEILFGK